MASRSMAPQSNSSAPAFSSRAAAMLMVLGVLVTNLAASVPRVDIGARDLVDTDSYMRVVRVRALLEGDNGWFDGSEHRSGAGHTMHWSRTLDVLMILLAAPFLVAMSTAEAIYIAALAVGPLLHLALAFAVAWALRPLLTRPATYLAGLAIAAQPGILSYAAVGRADHHVLIVIPAVLLVGATLRVLVDDRKHAAFWGGVFAGTGLWISTESLLPIVLSLAGLSLHWLWKGGAQGARFAASFACSCAAFALLERGLDLGSVEYDRLSLPHLVLACSLALGWAALAHPTLQKTLARRAVAGFLIAGSIAALMAVFFPAFFQGPFASVPAVLQGHWLDRVDELRPLAEMSATDMLLLLGVVLVALPALAWVVRKERGTPRFAGWIFLSAWVGVFSAVALIHVRFVVYPEALASAPLAAFVATHLGEERVSLGRSLTRVGLLAVLVAGFAALAGVASLVLDPAEASASGAPCSVASVASQIPQGAVVLASIDLGPELLYRTGASVVASPYHRNVEGILDTRRALNGPWPASREILTARRITHVLLCASQDEVELGDSTPDSTRARLLSGELPEEIAQVATPSAPPSMALFRVRSSLAGGRRE
ncbi:MAG: hypothetical protein AAGE52_34230 [Myxococcota bacterium]